MRLVLPFIGSDSSLQEGLDEIRRADSLTAMVGVAFGSARRLAVVLIEEELERRARIGGRWPNCPECETPLESKERAPRTLLTLVGTIAWRRPVGRCPKGCSIGQVVPLDDELGIVPGQRTSLEVKRLACLLAVFVPFGIAARLFGLLTGVEVSGSTIWNWVQGAGEAARSRLEKELKAQEDGRHPDCEAGVRSLLEKALLIGADGVMVPFRPEKGSPKGKIRWRQVLVGIIARHGSRITREGEEVPKLEQRRLVAKLCEVAAFRPFLLLEAGKQGLLEAGNKSVAWIADGGKALWDHLYQGLPDSVIGILDFYHAAEYLRKASKLLFGKDSAEGLSWFEDLRHKLRHGSPQAVFEGILEQLDRDAISDKARQTTENLFLYLEKHWDHIQYERFEELGLPRGSGCVESACKWLIQQRFKGVGMRWSQEGFDKLLALRVAWANDRFDELFPAAESRRTEKPDVAPKPKIEPTLEIAA